jgi:2-hydroxychromene-2-carboxylate isomerase
MKTIEYFLAPASPYAYLGHQALVQIAQKHGASIAVKPIDIGGRVFPISGGVPLGKRPAQRQAYRLVELKRWSALRGLPMNIQPTFFPVAGDTPSLKIIAADLVAGTDAALRLAGALMSAVWAQQRNIADPDTVTALIREAGLDPQSLDAVQADAVARYDLYTQQAIDAQVFGVPWFVYNNEPFWGQDRLDFLDRALS